MSIKVQFNPSTGKVSYNAVTGKVQMKAFPGSIGIVCCSIDTPAWVNVKLENITLPPFSCNLYDRECVGGGAGVGIVPAAYPFASGDTIQVGFASIIGGCLYQNTYAGNNWAAFYLDYASGSCANFLKLMDLKVTVAIRNDNIQVTLSWLRTGTSAGIFSHVITHELGSCGAVLDALWNDESFVFTTNDVECSWPNMTIGGKITVSL